MMRSLRRALLVSRLGKSTVVSAALCALSQAAVAQVAGGSQAGVGAPLAADSALLYAPAPPEPPQCIRRNADLVDSNDNRLSVWVSVRQPAYATIKASGSALGLRPGTLFLTLINSGITVANSPEVRGTGVIVANVGAGIKLVPGKQYKFTTKATVSNKKHILLHMTVEVGGTCPEDGGSGQQSVVPK